MRHLLALKWWLVLELPELAGRAWRRALCRVFGHPAAREHHLWEDLCARCGRVMEQRHQAKITGRMVADATLAAAQRNAVEDQVDALAYALHSLQDAGAKVFFMDDPAENGLPVNAALLWPWWIPPVPHPKPEVDFPMDAPPEGFR
jgi:hypothetical protein